MAQKRSYSIDGELSGSPKSGEPEFLAVGMLRRPHGIKGEIRMSVWTDFPERLTPGQEVYAGESHRPVHIRTVRWHGDDLLLSFEEYPVREDVGVLRNQVLMVRTENLPPLDEGEFYLHEFIGMTAVDDDSDIPLGEIVEILETGANDVFVVRDAQGSKHLIPDIADVILAIDLNRREVRIHLLPGLIE
jgi:16S rRNA processing protein RimM